MSLFHIILVTKRREASILQKDASALYIHILGAVKDKGKLYCINGTEDHIHILFDLHPGFVLNDVVNSIHVASSCWKKQYSNIFGFKGWEEKYIALPCPCEDKRVIIDYIKKQREHHQTENTIDELNRIWLGRNSVES